MTSKTILIGYKALLSFTGLTASLLFSTSAEARPLQIIHTNDLHSHMEKGDSDSTGGYAAVKAVMDQLRLKAQQEGIDTLVLDAGDFSEGNAFFLADEGKQSYRTMDAMGYDAIALGNHDWLIGTQQLNATLGAVNMKTPILSANLSVDASYQQIRHHIVPHAEFSRAGAHVAVMGLSTNEFVYRWRVQDGNIADPVISATLELNELRKRNDFVIALTHLGVDVDVNLASKTSGIDLVVGGHSHTKLSSPIYAKDQRGIQVPIVQTGQHGEYVGDLLVDIEPGKPLKVLHYQLVPVKRHELQDRQMASMVSDTRTKLEKRYGRDKLYEVVGYSEIPLERPLYGPTEWGNFCAEAVRQAGGADFSFDIGEFYGMQQPAGPITHEMIIQSYPRVFDLHKDTGWNVWTVKVPGWLLSVILDQVAKMGQFINTSGITYNVKTDSHGNSSVRNVRIQGKKIRFFHEYTIAVSEGIGKGAMDISFLLQLLFDPVDTGVPMWTAIEERIRQTGGVVHASTQLQ